MIKQACEAQMKCKEDTDETWTCGGHLHEGRSFECPYKSYTDAKARGCMDLENVKVHKPTEDKENNDELK